MMEYSYEILLLRGKINYIEEEYNKLILNKGLKEYIKN